VHVQPTFEEVLSAVRREAAPSPPTVQVRFRWHAFLNVAETGDSARKWVHIKRAYDDERPTERSVDQDLDHGIIKPFVLQPGLSVTALRRLRRQLAKSCHPDSVPAVNYRKATEQMALINRLIDDALARAISNGSPR
jgi:hypothetical protein